MRSSRSSFLVYVFFCICISSFDRLGVSLFKFDLFPLLTGFDPDEDDEDGTKLIFCCLNFLTKLSVLVVVNKFAVF
jgi:hypothetical protein